MGMYWGFALEQVAKRVLYLDLLARTRSIVEVMMIIRGFRKGVKPRARVQIPV